MGLAICMFSLLLFCFTISCCDDRHSLPVLLLLPFPDPSPDSGWDRGLELLPAARVAVREVNNRTDILPGYRLDLVERRSDACGISQSLIGFENFVDGAFRIKNAAVAVLGLACSTVTTAVSPIAGRSEVDLIQIAMANSNALRDQERFKHLWRVLSSVSSLVNAVVTLMEKLSWTRVAQLYDGNGAFFQSASNVFREHSRSMGFKLVVDQAIDEDQTFINSALTRIQSNSVRIIFVSATVPEAQLLMCEAAKRNLMWPGYVWIFHSRSADDLYDPNCAFDGLKQAIENVTLVDFNLDTRNHSDILVSGRTYKEYLLDYYRERDYIYTEFRQFLTGFTFANNPFSNLMYDEVWALALSINASLETLQDRQLYLENYRYNMANITEVIEGKLQNVEFEGAAGHFMFNQFQEASTPVSIYHVQNATGVRIGHYSGATKQLEFYNISSDDFPDDEFIRIYNLIPDSIVIVYLTLTVLAILFTIVMVTLMFWLYDSPQVRATSPLLSLLIYIGCCLMICGTPIVIFRRYLYINVTVFGVFCLVDRGIVETGTALVSFTFLFRLIRVYKIFHENDGFSKVGKYWKDLYLFVYVLLLSSVPVVAYILIGLFHYDEQSTLGEMLRNDVNPPMLIITPQCHLATDFYELMVTGYVSFGLVMLLVFAFLTRKIKYTDFKDTKKIVIFSYLFSIFAVLVHMLWIIFAQIGMPVVGVLLLTAASLLVAVAVQIFLFGPKVLPAARDRLCKKSTGHTKSYQSSTSSF